MSHHFDKIGLASQALYPPGAQFGRRTMRDFEFVWINQGTVIWHCDGQDYTCPPNTLILVRPGMTDAFTWDQVKQTVHSFIHFSVNSSFSQAFPQYADTNQWPTHTVLPTPNITYPLLEHLRFIQGQERVNRDLEQHCLLQILLSFINQQCGRTDERLNELHPAIQRVFNYLNALWTEDSIPMPNIAELTRASGTSEVHLGRLFRETFGTSPAKAVRAFRMERAANYLMGTNMRIQEISDILCCDTPYQFSRSFKSIYGQSPRSYREQFRERPLDMPSNVNLPWSSNLLDPMSAQNRNSPQAAD